MKMSKNPIRKFKIVNEKGVQFGPVISGFKYACDKAYERSKYYNAPMIPVEITTKCNKKIDKDNLMHGKYDLDDNVRCAILQMREDIHAYQSDPELIKNEVKYDLINFPKGMSIKKFNKCLNAINEIFFKKNINFAPADVKSKLWSEKKIKITMSQAFYLAYGF